MAWRFWPTKAKSRPWGCSFPGAADVPGGSSTGGLLPGWSAQLLEGVPVRLPRQSMPLGGPRNPKETQAFFCEPQASADLASLLLSAPDNGPRRRLCSLCSIARPLADQVRQGRPQDRKYGHEQAEQVQKRAAGRDVDYGFPPEAKFRRRSDRAVLELPFRARTRVQPLDSTTRRHEGEAAALCSWLLELHQPEGAEGGPSRGREGAAAQIAWHVCSERPGAALKRPQAGPDAGKEKKGIECAVSLCKLTS